MLSAVVLPLVTLATCPWKTPPVPPAVVIHTEISDRAKSQAKLDVEAIYDWQFGKCAAGTGEVRFDFLADGKLLLSKEPNFGRSSFKAWSAAWASATATELCHAAAPKDKTAPRPDQLTVKVRLAAGGDYAPLAFESAPVLMECPRERCEADPVRVQVERGKQQVHLTWSISRETLACNNGSTLDARFFASDGGREQTERLVPDFILAGLEKRLRRDPKDPSRMVLDETFPLSKVCGPGQRSLEVEFVGRGSLSAAVSANLRIRVRAQEDVTHRAHLDEACLP